MASRALAGYACAFGAGCVWGTLGLFVRRLQSFGLDALSITAWRTIVVSHIVLPAFFVLRRELFIIERKDAALVGLTGLTGVVLTQYSFIYSVTRTSVAVATILNYTAPLFVTIISRVCLREPITPRKVFALAMSSVGLVLILGLYDPSSIRSGPVLAHLAGLLSGFFFAVHTLISKTVVRRYHPLTAFAWASFVGGWSLALIARLTGRQMAAVPPQAIPTMALLCAGPGLVGFYLYLRSLSLVPASHASITAMSEPATAAFLGFAVLGEPFAPPQALGIAVVLAAIALVTTDRPPDRAADRSSGAHDRPTDRPAGADVRRRAEDHIRQAPKD
ncbi:MAG: DMT family transporter [Firmicutes bacterium]|jgi:drug/metabolite transporter (DMT)-like permease|nr:DMT family transporter [Bacillota bacterium]